MDLTTSETKLEQEQYASPRDFIVDLRHIFENARLYNTRDSEVEGRERVFSISNVGVLSTADLQNGQGIGIIL